MLDEKDIAEVRDVTGKSILTPKGWVRISKVYKTVPLAVVAVVAGSNKIVCSEKHLLMTAAGEWVHAGTIVPGLLVETVDGPAAVSSIEHLPEKQVLYDITIDDPSGQYWSDGFLSHNSTTFVARQLILSHLIPKYKSLYICPRADQLGTYGNRFLEMESAFRFPIKGQNKYSKVYKSSKSTIDFNYCLTSADAVRGKTVDEILIDEAQGMDPDILPEILKTQTITKIPSTIYAGTALSIDTLLEDKWQSSSKGVWHVRAGNGKDWLNMYDADTLKAVCRSREGPKCPITGKILNMRDGCYVHGDRKALLEGNIGLHVPQCIIPDLVTDPLQWGKIYLAVRDQDEKKVLQETFGIAVAESSREITEGDLRRICVLEDTEVETLEKCRNGYYRLILSGCDWGGSDHNQAIGTKTSYTVHCIIGVAPDDVVDILYYKRYFGMEYPKIIEDIAYNHKKYNGTAAGSDFGAGMYYNTTLRNLIPAESHFVLDYTTPRSAPLASPKGQHMVNQLSVNRTEAISSLYSALKSPHMKIRAKKWEEMSSYLLEWLNMYRAPIELPGGQTGFKYIRSSSKADDSLHAFNFAYILARFFLGEPMVNDVKLQNQLRDVLNGFIQPRENISEVADILFGPEALALHG